MQNIRREENDLGITVAILALGVIALIVMSTAKYFDTNLWAAGKFLLGIVAIAVVTYCLYSKDLLRNYWFILPSALLASFFPILNDWSNSKYPLSSLGKINPTPEWYALWYSQLLMVIITFGICYFIHKFLDNY